MGPIDAWVPIAGMLTGIVFMVGMFRTIRYIVDRRYEAKGLGAPDEVLDLKERVEYLEREAHRVEELEDRLDFAERLLAKGRESDGRNDA